MKLIGNNCYTGFLLKRIGQQFNTPFVWNRIMPDSYLRLVQYYNNINWANIKMFRTGDVLTAYRNIEDANAFGMTIDNLVTVYWWHYRYDANAKTPIVKSPNIYYCKNYEYTLHKYISRTKRMLHTADEPIFVYHSNTAQLNTTELNLIDSPDYLLKIITAANQSNHKLVLITQFAELQKYSSSNICVIVNDNILEDWDDMLDKHTSRILTFSKSN